MLELAGGGGESSCIVNAESAHNTHKRRIKRGESESFCASFMSRALLFARTADKFAQAYLQFFFIRGCAAYAALM